MSSLEDIKKKKMQEYMENISNEQAFMQNQAALQQANEMEAQIKKILSEVLSKEALERIANIKNIRPDFALQIEMYLIQLYQTGQLKPIITDAKLKNILDKLVQKKETKIIRK